MNNPDEPVRRYKLDPLGYWHDLRRQRKQSRFTPEDLAELRTRVQAQFEAPLSNPIVRKALQSLLTAIDELQAAYQAEQEEDAVFLRLTGGNDEPLG